MTLFEGLSLVAALFSSGGLVGVIFFGGRFVGRIEAAAQATVGVAANVQQIAERLGRVETSIGMMQSAHDHHMGSFHRELARRVDDLAETATEAGALARVASSHDWKEGKPR